MRSCLYECEVMHARLAPKRHRFAYRIFLFAVDLDELETLHRRLRLFSVSGPNLYSFRDRDFLPTHEPVHAPAGARKCHAIRDTSPRVPGLSAITPAPAPDPQSEIGNPQSPASALPPAANNPQSEIRNLKSRVLAHLAIRGIDLTDGHVLLVTLPRVLGYLFNPVSFYFCYDRHGEPVAALAEVTNTFREMKHFVLGPETRLPPPSPASDSSWADSSGPTARTSRLLTPTSGLRSPVSGAGDSTTFRSRQTKHFYVSPFSDVDVAFEFQLTAPGETLAVQIDDFIGADRTLVSTLRGPRRELTDASLAWFTVKYPFLTLRIIALIHWHALLLWLKRVPWFAKSARPQDQRDLFRPHASLTRPPATPPPPAASDFPSQPKTTSA